MFIVSYSCRSIDLTSLYVLFSQYKSRSNTLGNSFFQTSFYLRAHLRLTVKRQWGKFPLDLYWENKTYKLNRFIVLCFRHTMKLMWLDYLTYAELLSCVSIVNYMEEGGGGAGNGLRSCRFSAFHDRPSYETCQPFENCSEYAWNGLGKTTTSSFSQRFDSEKWIPNHDKWSPLWTVHITPPDVQKVH